MQLGCDGAFVGSGIYSVFVASGIESSKLGCARQVLVKLLLQYIPLVQRSFFHSSLFLIVCCCCSGS
jgi:hypothetical protein